MTFVSLNIPGQSKAQAVVLRIREMVGVTTMVVGLPGSVERSVGKAVRVIDRRPMEFSAVGPVAAGMSVLAAVLALGRRNLW